MKAASISDLAKEFRVDRATVRKIIAPLDVTPMMFGPAKAFHGKDLDLIRNRLTSYTKARLDIRSAQSAP